MVVQGPGFRVQLLLVKRLALWEVRKFTVGA